MRKSSTFSLFVIAFLFSTLVVIKPCQGLTGGGQNWGPRRPAVSIETRHILMNLYQWAMMDVNV